MKWLGAVFIVLAATWIGFESAKKFSERPRQLRQLKVILRTMEAEIMYAHTPLKKLSKQLAKTVQKPFQFLFEQFVKKLESQNISVSEAWNESLESVWKQTSLKSGELEVMKRFGDTLGQYDKQMQQQQIILALTHLEREEQEATEQQQKYEKLVKSVGFLTGLLLVILLM